MPYKDPKKQKEAQKAIYQAKKDKLKKERDTDEAKAALKLHRAQQYVKEAMKKYNQKYYAREDVKEARKRYRKAYRDKLLDARIALLDPKLRVVIYSREEAERIAWIIVFFTEFKELKGKTIYQV